MRTWWPGNFFLLGIFCLSSCAPLSIFNAGTVHVKYIESRAKFYGVKYRERARLTDPSVSIRNVQHPKVFGNWDLNLRLTPSIHYDDITYESEASMGLRRSNGEIDPYPLINIKRGIFMGNAKLTAHFPIGAFALAFGFGGSVYKINGGALDSMKTREVRKVDFTYTAFFSDRFFLLLGPRYYKSGYETFAFALRLGYFWGSPRG